MKKCNGVHCRCMQKDCPNVHSADCEEHNPKVEKEANIISAENKPPVGGMGGSIHDWERAKDPWHKDAFPTELKNAGTGGERKGGWFGLDYWGNVIDFVPDGAEIGEK